MATFQNVCIPNLSNKRLVLIRKEPLAMSKLVKTRDYYSGKYNCEKLMDKV